MIRDLSELDTAPSVLSIPGNVKNVERLAEWPDIDDVYISSANQKQMDTILDLINPESLTLDMVRARDFSRLSTLEGLRRLVIDSNSQIEDIAFLAPLTGLRELELKAIKNPLDLAPLSHLKRLRRLVLDGGFSRTMKAKSLAPLANLTNVSQLVLTAIRFEDDSLMPLAEMDALKSLRITNYFSTESYAQLYAARPEISCERFAAYSKGLGKSYLVTGKRKPFLEPHETVKLQKYSDAWDALVAKYQADLKG